MSAEIYTIATPSAIQKWGAFNDYMIKNCSYFEGFMQSPDGTNLDILAKRELTQQEQDDMFALIGAYTDPAYWMQLAYVQDMPMHTHPIANPNYEVLTTFIMSHQNQDESRIDSIKSVIMICTDNVENFGDYDSAETHSITLDIYDYTRGVVLSSVTSNLQNFYTAFKNQANADKTGFHSEWHSVQFYGLKDSLPNYDCIWQFRAKIDSARQACVSLNGLQKLYYYILTS